MKLGYTILYVPDVPKALDFYKQAFGLRIKFLHESNLWGEMETGATTLGFLAYDLANQNGIEFKPNNSQELPAGFELALVTDNVEDAYNQAIEAGAESVAKPQQKPWGQAISYVRDLNGILVEICSPMHS